MPKVLEVNAETGEEILRDMTDEELAEMEASAKRFDDAAKAEAKAALTAEASKKAILEKLGITAEEAKILLA